MNRYQILNAIQDLALSQGFYGRLLERIEEASEEDREAYLDELEQQCFANVVDLVIFLEG